MSLKLAFAGRVHTCSLVGALVLGSAGCNDEAGGTGDADDHHADGGHGEDEEEEEEVPCSDAYPTYEPGMSMQAGELTITLVFALPAPPRQKVSNEWTLEITDGAGEPLSGATISNADSYMEVHGHYGARRPSVKAQEEPGSYQLDGIDFKMRGPWQVLFDVQPEDGAMQSVRFYICVE